MTLPPEEYDEKLKQALRQRWNSIVDLRKKARKTRDQPDDGMTLAERILANRNKQVCKHWYVYQPEP